MQKSDEVVKCHNKEKAVIKAQVLILKRGINVESLNNSRKEAMGP
jgi:hypothetical protein